MRLGTDLRQSIRAVAQDRALTSAMQSVDLAAALGSASIAHGNATGLVLRMTSGLWEDDGTPGGVTARASRGVEA
mgnify:CR=1 FL=1